MRGECPYCLFPSVPRYYPYCSYKCQVLAQIQDLTNTLKMLSCLVLFLILTGCVTRGDIARQQSRVVSMSIECKQGDQTACDNLAGEVQKLDRMLEKPKW